VSVRFHLLAASELVEAQEWYEKARSGLGAAFAAEVERVVSLIDQHPLRFALYDAPVRRALLKRFPFSIYFEDVDGVRYIWAVFHHRRDRAAIGSRRTS